jgi:septin family protein
MEQWLPIEGFEDYQVSNTGRIKSLKIKNPNKILSAGLSGRQGSKYYIVVLCKDGKMYTRLVHTLVANAFLSNTNNKRTVDHIDRDRLNNNVSNLRFATDTENCLNRSTNVEYKYIYTRGNSFRVRINIKDIKLFTKSFNNLEDAIKYRDDILNSCLS